MESTTPIKQAFFNAIAPQFDTHVRQSIPLFGECIAAMVENIARRHTYGTVVDICGSTGELGRKLVDAGFKGMYINVDGSPEMHAEASRANNENALYAKHCRTWLRGYGASWADGAYFIEEVDITTLRPDVVVECLGFQFFTRERERHVRDLTTCATECWFVEKFTTDDWTENERRKDTLHKARFFSESEMQAKRDNVLVGMNEYLCHIDTFRAILDDNYGDVHNVREYVRFYKAGNFAGYTNARDIHVPISLTCNVYNAR